MCSDDHPYILPKRFLYNRNKNVNLDELMKSIIGDDVLDELSIMAYKAPHGALVEVGVYQGGSALRLYQVARSQNRPLYLYDTFEGIPFQDEIDVMHKGDFAETSYLHIKSAFPEAEVVKGVFPDSAVPMGPIAFVHLDCDQYRSVGLSAAYLESYMVKGGIMWFDDYGCLAGATRAVDELYKDRIQRAVCGKAYVTF